MKNFIARGDAVEITASYNIISGDVVVVGSMIGIAAGDIANGQNGLIYLTGVYDVNTRVLPAAWTVGAAVYWDPVNGEATIDATTDGNSNLLMGVALLPVGRVRLNGAFGVPVVEAG